MVGSATTAVAAKPGEVNGGWCCTAEEAEAEDDEGGAGRVRDALLPRPDDERN